MDKRPDTSRVTKAIQGYIHDLERDLERMKEDKAALENSLRASDGKTGGDIIVNVRDYRFVFPSDARISFVMKDTESDWTYEVDVYRSTESYLKGTLQITDNGAHYLYIRPVSSNRVILMTGMR